MTSDEIRIYAAELRPSSKTEVSIQVYYISHKKITVCGLSVKTIRVRLDRCLFGRENEEFEAENEMIYPSGT